MATTPTNTFVDYGIIPVYGGLEPRIINVALAPSLTLARGTVLGEIQLNDAWTVTLGAQTSGNFTLTYGGQTAVGPNVNDTYTISTGVQASGYYTLTWGGNTTGHILYTDVAATAQAAFVALSGVGSGQATIVLTSGTPGTDAVFTLTLTGTLGHQANTAVTASFAALGTPGNAALTKTATGAGGTAGFAYNAASATLQTAFLALSSVGAGNATITGSAGGPYTLTFVGALTHKANTAVTANFSTLTTPGNASIVQAVTGQALGTYKAYASGNTDGSQVAKGVLQFDCATDSSGNVTLGGATGGGPYQQTQPYAPMFEAGDFYVGDLTGLDATSLPQLGRMIQGTATTGGTLRVT